MTNKEKLGIFEYFLNKMEVKSIRQFTEFCLLNIPDYFFVLPASTTGINHGDGETLLNHVISCCYIAEQVCDGMFRNHWTERQKSQLYSAIILHDSFRCGEPEKECRISQEMIDRGGLRQDLLGELKTVKEHGEVAYRQLILLSIKYNSLADENKWERIGQNNLTAILRAVRYHMSSFYEIKDAPYSLSWPFDTVVQQTIAIDFHQTMNSMLNTRGKIIHTKQGE